MHPGRHGQGRHRRRRHRGGGGAADADFVGMGFVIVLCAVSWLHLLLGGGGQPASTPGTEWQVILAFGAMAGGLLLVMYGVRARGGARPPVLARRVAGAVMWHAGGPERLLPVQVALLLLPFIEAWFDFF